MNSYAKVRKYLVQKQCQKILKAIEKERAELKEKDIDKFYDQHNSKFRVFIRKLLRDKTPIVSRKYIEENLLDYYDFMDYPSWKLYCGNLKKHAEEILCLCNCTQEDFIHVTAEDAERLRLKFYA